MESQKNNNQSLNNNATYGKQNWIELRKKWTARRDDVLPLASTQKSFNPDALYDDLVSNDREGVLSQRVPLPELISVLAEVWEADGLPV